MKMSNNYMTFTPVTFNVLICIKWTQNNIPHCLYSGVSKTALKKKTPKILSPKIFKNFPLMQEQGYGFPGIISCRKQHCKEESTRAPVGTKREQPGNTKPRRKKSEQEAEQGKNLKIEEGLTLPGTLWMLTQLDANTPLWSLSR